MMETINLQCSQVSRKEGLARVSVQRVEDGIFIAQWLAHPITGEFLDANPAASFCISREKAPELFWGLSRWHGEEEDQDKGFSYEDALFGDAGGVRVVRISRYQDAEFEAIYALAVEMVSTDTGEDEPCGTIYFPDSDRHRLAYAVLECWR